MIDACKQCGGIHTTVACPDWDAPKLTEPNPVMLDIMKLYLQKYELLGDYDRGLYRLAIEFFVKPPMTMKS